MMSTYGAKNSEAASMKETMKETKNKKVINEAFTKCYYCMVVCDYYRGLEKSMPLPVLEAFGEIVPVKRAVMDIYKRISYRAVVCMKSEYEITREDCEKYFGGLIYYSQHSMNQQAELFSGWRQSSGYKFSSFHMVE